MWKRTYFIIGNGQFNMRDRQGKRHISLLVREHELQGILHLGAERLKDRQIRTADRIEKYVP